MTQAIIFDSPADFKKFVGNQNFRVTFRKLSNKHHDVARKN